MSPQKHLVGRRLLVIAHAFPPCGGAGVQRTAKTVAYLSRAGWQVSVLTVDPSSYGVRDVSHDVDADINVVRTPFFDPVVRFTRSAESWPPSEGSPAPSSPPPRPSWIRTLARLAWEAVDRHLLVPDRFVLWYREAVRTGVRMHRDRPFDMIYVTGDPYSAFLIAARIAQRVGVPYVLDMRDPWTLLPYRPERPTRVRAAIERSLESRVLRGCAACLFANRSVDAYREAFPDFRHKFHYVPNGYDPADFCGVTPRLSDKFTIVYNGSFLPGYRTADTFLHALRQLIDEDPSARVRLRVLFVGKIGAEREVSQRLGVQDLVTHLGYRSHRESLSYVIGADALLLVCGSQMWEETGKVFEYLAAGRPILALVQRGGAADQLLRGAPAAHVVDRLSISETANQLRQLMMPSEGSNPCPPTWLDEFTRENLAERVSRILEEAVRQTDHRPDL